VAVEDPFGRHDQPPLVLALEVAGPVSFSGSIDRVDATYDGRLIVVDYKTGKGYGYDNIPAEFTPVDGADLVDRGRKLQLMLYALAARNRHGDADTPVQSWFWFVEQGALRRGKSVTATDERRLLHVLDVSVSGIRAGTFPARPGEAGWKGWDNCGFCAYDRGCPTTRGESWEHVRSDPTVAGYATLAQNGRASTQGEQ
jgi:hypothetical protein